MNEHRGTTKKKRRLIQWELTWILARSGISTDLGLSHGGLVILLWAQQNWVTGPKAMSKFRSSETDCPFQHRRFGDSVLFIFPFVQSRCSNSGDRQFWRAQNRRLQNFASLAIWPKYFIGIAVINFWQTCLENSRNILQLWPDLPRFSVLSLVPPSASSSLPPTDKLHRSIAEITWTFKWNWINLVKTLWT